MRDGTAAHITLYANRGEEAKRDGMQITVQEACAGAERRGRGAGAQGQGRSAGARGRSGQGRSAGAQGRSGAQGAQGRSGGGRVQGRTRFRKRTRNHRLDEGSEWGVCYALAGLARRFYLRTTTIRTSAMHHARPKYAWPARTNSSRQPARYTGRLANPDLTSF